MSEKSYIFGQRSTKCVFGRFDWSRCEKWHTNKFVDECFLLIIASKNIPYRKILNVCRKALTFVLGLGIFLFLIGISNSGISRRGASGLGFGHPNVTAQLIMIIILLWTSEKAGKLKPISCWYGFGGISNRSISLRRGICTGCTDNTVDVPVDFN